MRLSAEIQEKFASPDFPLNLIEEKMEDYYGDGHVLAMQMNAKRSSEVEVVIDIRYQPKTGPSSIDAELVVGSDLNKTTIDVIEPTPRDLAWSSPPNAPTITAQSIGKAYAIDSAKSFKENFDHIHSDWHKGCTPFDLAKYALEPDIYNRFAISDVRELVEQYYDYKLSKAEYGERFTELIEKVVDYKPKNATKSHKYKVSQLLRRRILKRVTTLSVDNYMTIMREASRSATDERRSDPAIKHKIKIEYIPQFTSNEEGIIFEELTIECL